MEDFIEEIYQVSFIISDLKEFVFLINYGHFSKARNLYNKAMLGLEQWLEFLVKSNYSAAANIQHIALEIKNNYEDYFHTTGLVEGKLIPELYLCVKCYNTIDVYDGKYTLISSDTGFLTIKDNTVGLYLHDTHDPMYEAYQVIKSIYSPETEDFFILGCGLGYEVYQVFIQSEGAVKIHLYEEDSTLLDYAFRYGVLSLIPNESIEIFCNSNENELAKRFISDYNSENSVGLYISPSKKQKYGKTCNGEINRIITNNEFSRETTKQCIINLWKNKKINSISFSEMPNYFEQIEWTIISAGPSLDDCIPFLKQTSGKRGLIAVNTVLRRLLSENIFPDIIVAADSSNQLLKHIEGIEESTTNIPLIADWVLSWKYTEAYKGQICFVKTTASYDFTENFLPDEPVWDISGTVTALAIEAAVHLGARKIFLVGLDLAYPSGRMYAKGMPHSESPDARRSTKIPSTDGNTVETCEAFIWFKKAIEHQIKKYDWVEFINMSKHGAYIDGASEPDTLITQST